MYPLVSECPSPRTEILVPQDQKSARYCMLEMCYWKKTVEHIMGECHWTHQPTRTLPDCDQPLKVLELRELWKAKPDLPGISQLEQLT